MNTNAGSTEPSIRVLLVDDEVALLGMLERVLRGSGYAVQSAQNGAEGLLKFHQSIPDVVILDRAMPGLSGEEVARAIKKLAPGVPIILITGFLDAVTNPELFHVILAKPFRPTELLRCLADAVASRAGTTHSI